MVVVSFRRDGFERLRLRVQPGQPVSWDGDLTLVDFDSTPFSRLYGQPIGFYQDAEEWARATAEAFNGPRQLAELIIEDQAAADATPAEPESEAEPELSLPARPLSMPVLDDEDDELVLMRPPGGVARPARVEEDPLAGAAGRAAAGGAAGV